jgi:hypothetical protein
MERVYCSFCEQTYVTSSLEKCSLCGKVGGLRQKELSDGPIVSDEVLRSIASGAPVPPEWRPPNSRSVELRREAAATGELPALCMCCGAPADEIVPKNFSWHPGWVFILVLFGVLPFIIAAAMTMESARVQAPMCAKHRRHWSARTAFLLFTLLVPITVVVVAIVVAAQQRGVLQSAVSGGLCVGSMVSLAAWAIAAVAVQARAIRCLEITPDVIRLTNVSPTFVEATKTQQRRGLTSADEGGEYPVAATVLPVPRALRNRREVTLPIPSIGSRELPAVCMRCGKPASNVVPKTFGWHPGWVYLMVLLVGLPYILLYVLLSKRVHLQTPFCDKHKRHWASRRLILAETFILCLMVLAGLFLADSALEPQARRALDGLFVILFVVLPLGWILVPISLHMTSIRATGITQNELRLTNVSPKFAEAVRAQAERDSKQSTPEPLWGSSASSTAPSDAFRENR